VTNAELTELIIDNTDSLFRISYSILRNSADAEDAVQSAIIKAYSNISRLRNNDYAKTGLIRILINECKMHIRKVKREVVEDPDEYKLLISLDCNQSKSDTVEAETRLDVWSALGKLDPDFRTVLILKYVEGYKLEEIAKMTGVMKGTVGSRLSRAKKQLRTILADYED